MPSILVSVPSFGDSFFICSLTCDGTSETVAKVSVPSFGDSFFMRKEICFNGTGRGSVSVPSFGDSFFIKNWKMALKLSHWAFPSPHSGILFLYLEESEEEKERKRLVSVPSFGDSFFMLWSFNDTDNMIPVSVPSFGDSFFMLC